MKRTTLSGLCVVIFIQDKIRTMDQDHLLDLMLACFGQQISPEESEELYAWVEASPDNKAFFSQMHEVWVATQMDSSRSEYDAERAYRRFRQKARQYGNRRNNRRRFALAWQWVSAFAVMVLAVLCSYHRGEKQIRDAFTDIVIEAPFSSQSHILLPDSTEVWMNAGSRLTYSQGFGLQDRNIEMSGECYFSVAKDASKPFVVTTPTLQVRVLGTKFNFRSYPDDGEAVVSLEEGSVSLKNLLSEGAEHLLSPNQKAILDNRTGRLQIKAAQPDNHSAWVQGRLFFNDELLVDIVKELHRNYDVRIDIVSDSLLTQRFYGGFDRRDLSIDEILDRFAATGNIHYRKEGNKIILY